jgi:hypothetical protein
MGLLHHHISDHRNPGSLAARMRRRRFAAFRTLVAEFSGEKRILDVGGTAGFWQAMGAGEEGWSITVLNRTPPSAEPYHPALTFVVGDARDMSGFSDRSFDLVFSNSVIEHVGEWRDQQRMAAEVRRVGKRYFVQTPNRYFPIEPHFLLPLFQFYPRTLQVELTRRFALGWYERIPDLDAARAHVASHRLLTRREMQALFPDAELQEERIAGLTKSLCALGPRT